MFKRHGAAAMVLLVLVACVSVSAAAQTVTGTLSGSVVDSTGALVPNVTVTAKNKETGLVRTVSTNSEGTYLMSFLPLGPYDVTVEGSGFQRVIKTDLLIELNKTTISPFTLSVSTVGEQISIAGETPLIETTTGEIKHSLDAKRIEDTPLAGRNFISLVEQIPGFQNAPWIGSSNNPTNSTGSYASFSGQGSRSATFQIDGVNNDDSSENQNRQNVNVSTIKEFQVLTNAYSAEFGRAGGAVILVQTKSGGNQFHGDLYDFVQNDIFNANGFFRNKAGRSATTGQELQPRQTVRRHQYGWTVGGPLWLPKKAFGPAAYDGRDKVFFFISGERVSNKTSGSVSRFMWLPTDVPRACNPKELESNPRALCVDPTTHPNLQRDLAYMRSVIDLWKTPELSGVVPNDPQFCADMIRSGRQNRCVTLNVINVFPDSDYTGRLDVKASSTDNINLRYQYSRQIRESGRIIFGDNFGTNNNRQYNIGSTWTHVFSNRQVGEFRYGFGNRSTLQDVADDNAIPTIRFGNTLCAVASCNFVIGTSTNVPINRRQQDHQLVYNHTITIPKHTLKMGVDQRFQLLDDVTGDRARGFWTFSSLDTAAQILGGTGFTGWENFLRGFVTNYQKGFGNPTAENRFGETNLYFEDKYQMARTLTVYLGGRYEYVRAPKEAENRFEYGYSDDKDNIEPRIGFAWSPSADEGFFRALTGGPGAFVIRGGYGIYHSRLFQSVFSQNQLSIRTQPPNGYAQVFDGQCRNEISDPSCGFVFTPGVASYSQPFTAVSDGGKAIVRDIGGRLNSTLLIPAANLEVPYTQQWNLTMERQIGTKFAVQVGYNGNRGIGLPFYDSGNDAIFPFVSPNLLVDVGGGNFRNVVFDRACTDSKDPICQGPTPATSGPSRDFLALNSTATTPVPATLANKGIVIENGVPHGYISSTQPRTNERRPDPTLVRFVNLQNFGWSYYNAGIVKATQRLSNGLSFTASYTFSKTIDTGSEATFTGVDTNAPTSKQGGAAQSLRGLSGFHAAHRFVASYSYLLPWFRSQPGILGHILGGWQITGITTLQSGNPFTVTLGYDVNADGLGSDRPRLADLSVLGRSVDNGRQLTSTGNPADTISQTQLPGTAFIPNNAATVTGDQRIFLPGTPGDGTLGRNTFYTHGLNYTDMTFGKEFRITESSKLLLRMEFYNIFNRVSFDTPARTIVSATPTGRITAQRNPANFVNSGRDNGSRMGQVALRLVF